MLATYAKYECIIFSWHKRGSFWRESLRRGESVSQDAGNEPNVKIEPESNEESADSEPLRPALSSLRRAKQKWQYSR